jgi:hypothetical protein
MPLYPSPYALLRPPPLIPARVRWLADSTAARSMMNRRLVFLLGSALATADGALLQSAAVPVIGGAAVAVAAVASRVRKTANDRKAFLSVNWSDPPATGDGEEDGCCKRATARSLGFPCHCCTHLSLTMYPSRDCPDLASNPAVVLGEETVPNGKTWYVCNEPNEDPRFECEAVETNPTPDVNDSFLCKETPLTEKKGFFRKIFSRS